MTWEPVIGIEVHVELRTRSKMFCSCAVSFGEDPNTSVCPVCLGLPGSLPVPNRTAIEWLTRLGLALQCEISPVSVFHRKNYFYADLPKNYQISQYDIPVAHDGWLDVDLDGAAFRVGIERAHMEEDTGKSVHVGAGGRIQGAEETLLDFNRAGVPLVEVVSKPDLRSAEQARAYAQELRALVVELDISDARMEEGSIRFDANVSVRPSGTDTLGTKVEVKNMNSFRSLERAIAHEIDRQIEVIEGGGQVEHETRHWNEEAGVTHGMRTKEESSDYRYFTEPDLVPMVMDEEWRTRIGASLPELPGARRSRYLDLGLDPHQATVLVRAEPGLRTLFAEAIDAGADARLAANWLTGEVTAWMRREEMPVEATPLAGAHLAELGSMVGEGVVSASAAKEVLAGVLAGEGSPREVAVARDLVQLSDVDAVGATVSRVLADNPEAVDRYHGGEEKVLGFLVGAVMRATGGKADPRLVNRLLREGLR